MFALKYRDLYEISLTQALVFYCGYNKLQIQWLKTISIYYLPIIYSFEHQKSEIGYIGLNSKCS